MKRLKPREGELIEVNNRPVFSTKEGFNAADAVVIDLLNVQFTAELQDGSGTLTYRFYSDQGDSWRFKDGAA